MFLRFSRRVTFLLVLSTLITWVSVVAAPMAHAASVSNSPLPVSDWTISWGHTETRTIHLTASQCAALTPKGVKPSLCTITQTSKTSLFYNSRYAQVKPHSVTSVNPNSVIGGGGGGSCPSGTLNHANIYQFSFDPTKSDDFHAELDTTWAFPGNCTTSSLTFEDCNNLRTEGSYSNIASVRCDNYAVSTGLPFPDLKAQDDTHLEHSTTELGSQSFTVFLTTQASTYNGTLNDQRWCNITNIC